MIKKNKLVRDLAKDEIVNDVFVVKFKKPVEQYKNGYKFELRLGDSSKEIMYKYWGPNDEERVKQIYEMIHPDDVVLVQGRVNEWNSQLEISANEHNDIRVLSDEEYDASDFVRKTTKPIEVMCQELIEIVDSVQDENLKKILEHFFKNKEFMDKFKVAPAAMYVHHGWIGGLLEHTLSVAQICDSIIKIHEINRDLAITGALLHDIGKLEEFNVTTSIRMSTKGMLIGHVSMGVKLLQDVMEEISTPEDLKIKITHIILTHMGEYGSSKLPSFPEALVVYMSDWVDARLTQMKDLKDNAQTEDESIWHKDFGNIFLK